MSEMTRYYRKPIALFVVSALLTACAFYVSNILLAWLAGLFVGLALGSTVSHYFVAMIAAKLDGNEVLRNHAAAAETIAANIRSATR